MILSQVTPVSSSILNLIYDSSFIMYVPLQDRVLNNLSCIQPQSWSKLVNEALKTKPFLGQAIENKAILRARFLVCTLKEWIQAVSHTLCSLLTHSLYI